jgi:Carboxypeptidase regulatory-like domain
MNTLTRLVILVVVSLGLACKAHADAVATLYGTVKDAKGQPLQGAEIRIQGSDPAKIGKVHTDAQGHYSYAGLETGTYRVTLIVAGTTKACIGNVSAKSGETQSLNFDLKSGAAARPFTKGKHYVWIPSSQITGSHLGVWAEVSDGAKPMAAGMQDRIDNQGNYSVREFQLEHPSVRQ